MKIFKNLKLALLALVMALPALLMTACSEAVSKINDASDAIDAGNYAKAKRLCDEVRDEHWGELDVYDKVNLAGCYMSMLGEGEVDEDEAWEAFRHCWDSAKEDDEAEVKDYTNEVAGDGSYDMIERMIELHDLGKGLEELGSFLDW